MTKSLIEQIEAALDRKLEEVLDRTLEEVLGRKLDEKLDARFDDFERKLDQKLDQKLDDIFNSFEKKIDQKIDQKFDQKFTISEKKMDRKMGVFIEHMDDKFNGLAETLQTTIEIMGGLAKDSDLQEVKADIATIKFAVKETNEDLGALRLSIAQHA